MTLIKRLLENIVGKDENPSNQHFPISSQCFLPFPKEILIIQLLLSTLNQDKICHFFVAFVEDNATMSSIRYHACHNFFRQIRDNGLNFPGFAVIFRDRL